MNTVKLTKTEKLILDELKERGKVDVFGKRQVNAARKLVSRGLIGEFKDECEYVSPRDSMIRDKNGNYKGYYSYFGTVSL